MSHVIEGTLVMLLQFFVYGIYTVFFMDVAITLRGSLILAGLLFLTGQAGLGYGDLFY